MAHILWPSSLSALLRSASSRGALAVDRDAGCVAPLELWRSEGHRAYFYALDQLSYTDGTIPPLLDSTVFVAISEFNDGGLHYQNYVPAIAAGNGLKGGSNLALPTEFKETFMVPAWARTLPGPKNRTPNDLWQSVLQTLGVYQAGQKFGAPSVTASPVPGLWV